MRKLSNIYNIWSDGSYSQARGVGGAGWVIEHDGNRVEGSAPIRGLSEKEAIRGSVYAELLAVERSLALIPSNSVVNLKIDAQNIIDWLEHGKLPGKQQKEGSLVCPFAAAFLATTRMQQVTFTKVSDRNNENFQRAHKLSKEAASIARKPA